jgi:hypothetical protein
VVIITGNLRKARWQRRQVYLEQRKCRDRVFWAALAEGP